MRLRRRELRPLAGMLLVAGLSCLGPARGDDPAKGTKKMYGMIGKMIAVEGKRDELIAILLRGTREMPGCLNYVVARDPADTNAVWVSEVWDDRESHKASLALPAVKSAIAEG